MFTYNVASREVAYGVLRSQRNRTEHDEDQDEVGEDLMVDELMAEHTKPAATDSRTKKQSQKAKREIDLTTVFYFNISSVLFLMRFI